MEAKMALASEETQEERSTRLLLAALAELGGGRVTDDDLRREGKQLILPETMEPKEAIAYLKNHIAQQEEVTRFDRTFRYRPFDGAHALQAALTEVFGTAGIGRATWSWWDGRVPPQMISVTTGPRGESTQVPWGEISFPIIHGTLYLLEEDDDQWGPLFRLLVEAPRKYRAHVEGLFIAIERQLRSKSIYKGRPVDGQTVPEFLDLRGVEESKVIYSDEATVQLSSSVWSLLRYSQNMRDEGLPLKRSVLLYGPYGCGKTLAAFLTAKIAEENGWTFIYCRPGKDDLDRVMSTARLYQPAVVFFEDVDVLAESGEKDTVTRLLDIFDGITSKGTEIVAVMTTNHVEKIHKAMVRPGRLDALIPIEGLDRNGVERLIEAIVPVEQLDEVIDYDAVYESMEGFLPAFVKESVDRARRYAIARNEGRPDTLTTEDLIHAAEGLKPHLDLMNGANEGKVDDRLSTALRREVREELDTTRVTRGGEPFGELVPGNGGRLK
jgi:hypothetical protein